MKTLLSSISRRSPNANPEVAAIIDEGNLNFDLDRVKQEFYGRRANWGEDSEADEYDCPDLVEIATDLRKRLLPYHEKRMSKLVNEITSLFNFGIVGGKHWADISGDPYEWVKNDTKFSHTIRIDESELDLGSKFEDYPVVDIYVDYAEPKCHPSLSLQKLAAVMNGGIAIDFRAKPTISLVGSYEGHFCHVDIHLNNKRGEKVQL
jgi:hypothetical protein